METNEKILVERTYLEKIKTKLEGLKVTVNSDSAEGVIYDILNLLDDELKVKQISVKSKIYSTMEQTKFSNPDLNFKLYILHRKLQENKISDEEALRLYKCYING